MKKILLSLAAIAGTTILMSSNASALDGTTSGGCKWEFDTTAAAPSFVIGPATPGGNCQLTDTDDNLWSSNIGSMQYNNVYIKIFTIQPGVKAPAIMDNFFDGLESVESIDVNNLDVSGATSMVGAFIGTGNWGNGISSLDLSNWDTSNVTNMFNMFGETNIEYLSLGSNFDTSKVTNFTQMFYDSAFRELMLNFDTTNATTMDWMFNNARDLQVLEISSFAMNRPSPININDMFSRMGSNVPDGTTIILNETFGRASDTEWANYNFPKTSYDVLDRSNGLLLGSSVATADINAMLSALAPGTAVGLYLAGSIPITPVGPVNPPVNPVAPGTPSGASNTVGAPNSGVFTSNDGFTIRSFISCAIMLAAGLIATAIYVNKKQLFKK